MRIKVIDKETGHPWLKPDLVKCDWYAFDHRTSLDGFSLDEDGDLLLSDRSGNTIAVPNWKERFEVKIVE